MVKLDFSELKKARVRDYAIRFLFGGAVSVFATLLAQWTTERIGGIFTAFPAILLASLTIIGTSETRKAADADAQGGILGAVALVVAAIVLAVTLGLLAGALSLALSLAAWLACSIGLYILSVKAGWLHPKSQ